MLTRGECQSEGGPCQQLCYDLHDGTFECGCSEGYVLSTDGYSCHPETNSSSNASSTEEATTGTPPSGTPENLALNNINMNTLAATTTATAASTTDQTTGCAETDGDDGGGPGVSREVDDDYDDDYVAFWSCDQLSCQNGGQCVATQAEGGVRCNCKLGFAGPYCNEEMDVKYPSFSGNSYIVLPTLRDAHRSMQISLEFKPETHNALLLYSGEQANLQGDYVAILLVEGFVEFRFDCGMGEGILRSDQPVVLSSWNKLSIYRDRWDAWMQLNNDHQVQGRSKGLFSRITFRDNLYLGGSPNITMVEGRLRTDKAFIGCVRKLEINNRNFDFRSGVKGDALDGADIGECRDDACNNVLCQNGGQCVDHGKTASCICPLGYEGEFCDQEVTILVPAFNGSSFMRFPGLGERFLSFLEITVVLKPRSLNGVFFYNGDSLEGQGDFIMLQLVNGFVEFRFDLGNGAAIVRSDEAVTVDKWHTISISRTGQLGILRVDKHPYIVGFAPGAFTQLSLDLNLYIGGVPSFKETSPNAAITHNFAGCIQKVTINNKPLKLLQEALTGRNVNNCAHPCVTGPCYNGGQCEPTMDEFQCHCKLGFSGQQCEIEVQEAIAQPMMGGQSFLHYTAEEIIKRVRGSKIDIQMKFRSFSGHGLLLWAGEKDVSRSSDFVSLGINKGQLVFRFNLGSGEGDLVYNYSRVDDGHWHTLRAIRYRQEGSLTVDDGPTIVGTSFGQLNQLTVNSGLFLGGIRDLTHMTLGRYQTGLVGCIGNFTLSTDYHVRLVTHANSGINVQPCI
ncbi:pikachurin-like isoform X1 [Varroa jacobsoni]|uniref:pikachurin-like isoform X1 n=2 Tax=Varroa jacobsoni TaxID=62625 RepID=UPI000BF88F26|nr:pikachurin-like isoform X1 [Varroa jacobsoni]